MALTQHIALTADRHRRADWWIVVCRLISTYPPPTEARRGETKRRVELRAGNSNANFSIVKTGSNERFAGFLDNTAAFVLMPIVKPHLRKALVGAVVRCLRLVAASAASVLLNCAVRTSFTSKR